jgi:dihydrofolate reductase
MKFFREKTNNSIVVMGRKTYDSLPIKPLPNRINVVITSKINKDNHMEVRKDGVIYIEMDAIKEILKNKNDNPSILPWDIFIIGGGQIYKELLQYCDFIYLTKILHSHDNVDTYFPNIDAMLEWRMTDVSEIKEYNGIQYKFYTYKKRGE